MKIINPQTMGIMYKPYTFQGRVHFVVTAIGFFRLGAENARFLTANLQWPLVQASLPVGQPLDDVMPKRQAEVLLLGNAHSPGQVPCSQMLVQLALDDASGAPAISKCLCVCGDREWQSGFLARRKVSAAKPFSSMPIQYSRAFGGPGYAPNPDGCGERDKLFVASTGRMPNISYPESAVSDAWRNSVAAGFGPIKLDHPSRRSKLGSYTHWLEQDAPGFARDIDWSAFNLAPPDQWLAKFLQGGEQYRLHNMHPTQPVLSGKVPKLQARAFIMQEQQTAQDAREVPLAMDTLWFLPEHELGIALYHGEIEINDSDALDVKALMIAYEAADAPKSLAHYREVMALRLDPETCGMHSFNESQLAAAYSDEELARRAAEQAQAEAAALEKSQRRMDAVDAKIWAARGQTPPEGYISPRAKLPPLGLLTEQTVKQGDFDLTATIAKAKQMSDAVAEQGRAALAKLPPSPAREIDPAAQLAGAIERAALPAYDLLNPAEAASDPTVAHMLASLDAARAHRKETGVAEKPGKYEADRQALLKLPAIRRQGRRAALKVSLPALPLLPSVAHELGAQVMGWLTSGICLAGRDLAGADLRGADFRGADLREVMLEGANLAGALFDGADLRGAVFTGATLDQASFVAANLQHASFSHSSGSGICMQAANLADVNAFSAHWPKANLNAANLQRLQGIKMHLSGASLNEVCASKATLLEICADDTSWQRAELDGTMLMHASLQRSDFSAARLTKTSLSDALLQNSRWQYARLDHVQSAGSADWSGAQLMGLIVKDCGFHSASFKQANLQQAKFLKCDFTLCDFDSAQLGGVLFSDCAMLQARFCKASAAGAEFFHSLCRKVDFSGADIVSASFAQCELTEAIGTDGKTDCQRRCA